MRLIVFKLAYMYIYVFILKIISTIWCRKYNMTTCPSCYGEVEFFFWSVQCIFTILLLFFFGERHGSSFEQIWIPYNQECFVPIKFGSNWPSGSRGGDFEMLLMHFYYFVIISTLRWTNFDQKSSLEASAQVS